MGRGRKPCCDKAGVKRGPWTQAEDLRLVSYIQKHGHPNWRALPKQAGLPRCGKSCRLRWINYLRPDIKRGNFTREEEDRIIKLHEILGNKWSRIASQLPGRTDNEIKNFWNTHLKKRLTGKGSKTPHIEQKELTSDEFSPANSTVSNDPQGLECALESGNIVKMCPTDKTLSQSNPACSSYGSEFSHMNSTDSSEHGNSSYGSEFSHMNSKDSSEHGNGEAPSSLHVTNEKVDNVSKHELLEEIIEIPYEPNIDLWEMIDTDSGADSEVSVSKVKTHQHTISEEEENKREVDRGWWWLAYLENELGLDATTTTTTNESKQKVTTESASQEPPILSPLKEEQLWDSEIDPVLNYFHTYPTSPQNIDF